MRFEKDFDLEGEDVQSADWKGGPGETLHRIDTQLKAFGLEVVMSEDGDDTCFWRVEKRQ